MYVTRERRPGRKPRHGARFIFWTVESFRDDGRVRTRKLAYLGSIYEHAITRVTSGGWSLDPSVGVRDRHYFWQRARLKLERLGASPDMRDRLVDQLAAWVPAVTADERMAVMKRAAEAEAVLAGLRH